MPKREMLPMSGGSGDHEVICIEATKVCDFCFQEHRVDRTFNVNVPTGVTEIMCNIDEANVTCRVVERREVEGTKKQLVCVAITVPVTFTVGTETFNQTVTFLKQAVLCAPEGTQVRCDVTGNCCCFLDPATGLVTCVFDFCVVIKTQVQVRVLVPTLGMCTPKRCRSTIVGCPPSVPDCGKNCNDDC